MKTMTSKRGARPGLAIAVGLPAAAPADGAQNETQDEVGTGAEDGKGQGDGDGGPGEMAEDEVCLPLDALSMPDESEQMQAPAVGDAVQFSAEGHVTRIEGDKAYVALKSVNGQELPEEEEEPREPTDEEQMASLEAEARRQPDRYG